LQLEKGNQALTTPGVCSGFSYKETHGWASAVLPLAAGIFADVASLGLYVPVDVVVQRLQLGKYSGLRQALKQMWKEEVRRRWGTETEPRVAPGFRSTDRST
jgi:CubicO group peptidase (beta-lactamase class C family)